MLSKQGIRRPVSHDLIAGSDVDPSKFRTILKKQEMLTPPGERCTSHTLPIRVCAAQKGRDFEAPDLERSIHFRGVF